MNKLLFALPLLLLLPKKNAGTSKAGVLTISTFLATSQKTEVKIYIPAHLIASHQAASDLVVWLHGHNPNTQSLNEITERHNLEAQISKMSQRGRRRNSVWVAPYSTGKCDQFNEIFSSVEKTKAFLTEVLRVVATKGVSMRSNLPLVLAGQSGAGVPIRKFLTLTDNGTQVYWPRVREVYLFDALYNAAEAFADFALQSNNRFWTVYGVSTEKGAQAIYQMVAGKTSKGIFSDLNLGGSQKPPIKKPAPKPAQYLAGQGLFESFGFTEQEKAKPIGFLSSPVEHKFTARNYLAAILS